MRKKWQASQAFNINSATSVMSLFFNKFILFNGKIRPYFGIGKIAGFGIKTLLKYRKISTSFRTAGMRHDILFPWVAEASNKYQYSSFEDKAK